MNTSTTRKSRKESATTATIITTARAREADRCRPYGEAHFWQAAKAAASVGLYPDATGRLSRLGSEARPVSLASLGCLRWFPAADEFLSSVDPAYAATVTAALQPVFEAAYAAAHGVELELAALSADSEAWNARYAEARYDRGLTDAEARAEADAAYPAFAAGRARRAELQAAIAARS